MRNVLEKIFGNANVHYLKNVQSVIDRINGLEKELERLPSDALKEQTKKLKERLAKGESIWGLLDFGFALVREAAKRTLHQRHFDVQLMGGIALHQGKIAEMKTGEGKTLVATLPAYLNALEEKAVHIVTVNDYLAKRDAVWMGQIYWALGLSVSCITHDASYTYDPSYKGPSFVSTKDGPLYHVPLQEDDRDRERDTVGGFRVIETYLRPASRKEAYLADITYGTNNEFGFDYLRDNMVYDLSQLVQRGHYYAIVDEVDSILIDEARTPLIISAPDQESSRWYEDFARIIPRLNPQGDFEIDEKMRAVTLTESGIDKVEQVLGVQDIYQERGIKYLHHLEQALRAEVLFKRDRDYVVKNGEVIIVDEFTGRLLQGRRFSGGLHQALEAKEGVRVQPESLTLASITFQNYFRMYKKLAGMTGTAATSAEEFHKVYGLETVVMPTNKPMIRQDLPDRVYTSQEAKLKAVVQEIRERHEKGQPVLVGTVSIAKNELLSKMLEIEGVSHQVLNAKHHEREGAIIAQTGKLGAVTVATNMAGRGVDIILGGNPPDEKEAQRVRELGGLHVIGTERHEARRIDNQLRGRTGRQGDAGSSQFLVSLEDDLIRIFGGERIKQLMERFHFPEDQSIESRLVSQAMESAQAKIEGMNFDMRKHLLEYDDVLNKHREVLYKKRREILEKTLPVIRSDVQSDDWTNLNDPNSIRFYVLNICKKFGYSEKDYEKKEKELGEKNMRQAEKLLCLRVIDSLWVEHLENMEYLRDSVRLRAYGQQDPLIEYKNEGHKMFRAFLDKIDELIAHSLMRAQLTSFPPEQTGGTVLASSTKKIGRNDPCPCGSGKKYKKCHGK